MQMEQFAVEKKLSAIFLRWPVLCDMHTKFRRMV